jgi:arylsulfotransferase ASST
MCAAAIAGAPDAGAATRIGASPALYPAFSPKVSDYVSRCHTGRKLRLAIHAAHGTRVAVGGRKPEAGKQEVALNLAGGQGVSFRLVRGKKRSTHHVRCLPKDFIKWYVERHGKPQARFYIVTPAEGGKGSPFVVIFDTHGVPVWWMRAGLTPIDAKLLPDGNLAWSGFRGGSFALESAPYEEHRLDGSLVRRIAAVGVNTDFHDLQVMPNGDYLFLSYVPRDEPVDLSPYGGPKNATVLDGVIQRVSRGGKLVWSWNSKDHVATSESTPRMATVLRPGQLPDGRTAYDLVHINSVEPAPGAYLVSLAFTGGVYKISRATGAVEWKLGGEETDRSLEVVGEPAGSPLFGSQHDARLLRDGTLTLHDNRSLSGLAPRAARYRIDESARTATFVEQVLDPQVPGSLCCGSARRLPGGNWVASWGFNPVVDELSPSGKIVFGLHFGDDLFSYRAVPVLGKQLSVRALRAGMDAMHGG